LNGADTGNEGITTNGDCHGKTPQAYCFASVPFNRRPDWERVWRKGNRHPDHLKGVFMEIITLHVLQPGEKGTILSISNARPILRLRLLEMGLTRGAAVEFVQTAPLGNPIEIRIRGYRLLLRKEEAALVRIARLIT
jgi:ferrous iron transport protein A